MTKANVFFTDETVLAIGNKQAQRYARHGEQSFNEFKNDCNVELMSKAKFIKKYPELASSWVNNK